MFSCVYLFISQKKYLTLSRTDVIIEKFSKFSEFFVEVAKEFLKLRRLSSKKEHFPDLSTFS